MGCTVQLHETPHRRKTWAEYSVDAYYVEASPKHYRCHKVCKVKTKSERISKTVFFKHKYIIQPTFTSEDIIIKALQDLKHAIKGTKNVKSNANLEALKKMKAIVDETPVAKVKEKAKKLQFAENVLKVLNYSEDPRVPFMQNLAKVTNKQTNTYSANKCTDSTVSNTYPNKEAISGGQQLYSSSSTYKGGSGDQSSTSNGGYCTTKTSC